MSARPAAKAAPDPWWAREDLHYLDGRLQFAGHDVAGLAEAADGPLYLYSAARVAANLTRLREALAHTGRPAQIYYAIKANRFVPLLRAMAAWGLCGADICSPDELDLALACGFASKDLSFTGTAVSNRDLERLLRQPRLTINCDTVGQIRRVGERAPGRAIGVRVNPALGVGYGDDARLTYAGETVTKFGIYREQWAEALATARRFGLRITSLHFHVGVGYLTHQLDRWAAAAAAGLAFADDLPDLATVNVGGGLGVPHRAADAPLDLPRWSATLAELFAGRDVTVAVEPGDYIVKDAGMLVLSVVDVERKRDRAFAYLEGGFNLAPEPAYYDLPCEPAAVLPRSSDPADWTPLTLVGNINEALDVWAADHPMPPLAEGDRIAFLNAGGYGAAMASNHCLRGAFTERLL
jgi:diaminopimelate decarboxylase